METAGPEILLCARRRKLTPLMPRPKIMYGGGDGARALLVSVLDNSVNIGQMQKDERRVF